MATIPLTHPIASFKKFLDRIRNPTKKEEKKETPADTKPTETEVAKPTETAPAEPAAPAEGKKMRCTLAKMLRKFKGNSDIVVTPPEAPKTEEAAAPTEPAAPAESEAPAAAAQE